MPTTVKGTDLYIPDLRDWTHAKLYEIRQKVVTELLERVEKGDPVVGADGSIDFYRPVKAEVLSNILVRTSGVIHDIEVEKGEVEAGGVDITLKELADSLRRFAKATEVKGEAVRE